MQSLRRNGLVAAAALTTAITCWVARVEIPIVIAITCAIPLISVGVTRVRDICRQTETMELERTHNIEVFLRIANIALKHDDPQHALNQLVGEIRALYLVDSVSVWTGFPTDPNLDLRAGSGVGDETTLRLRIRKSLTAGQHNDVDVDSESDLSILCSTTELENDQQLVLVLEGGPKRTFGKNEYGFAAIAGGMIGTVIIRQQRDEELRQAQTFDAIGRLSAGLAHEINTPIHYVANNLGFLNDAIPQLIQDANGSKDPELEFLQTEVPESLRQAHEGMLVIANIIKSMKTFSHVSASDFEAADINEAMRMTLALAQGEIRRVAELNVVYGRLPDVVCQVTQLHQVFLNLIVNAAHAISDKNERNKTREIGTISVRTWKDRDHVVIAVGDTGCGIPKENRSKIFEPFFTTKEVGRGTGQGLALVRRIVLNHGGTIRYTSDSSGTVFCVRLPTMMAEIEPAETEVPANAVAPELAF